MLLLVFFVSELPTACILDHLQLAGLAVLGVSVNCGSNKQAYTKAEPPHCPPFPPPPVFCRAER